MVQSEYLLSKHENLNSDASVFTYKQNVVMYIVQVSVCNLSIGKGKKQGDCWRSIAASLVFGSARTLPQGNKEEYNRGGELMFSSCSHMGT